MRAFFHHPAFRHYTWHHFTWHHFTWHHFRWHHCMFGDLVSPCFLARGGFDGASVLGLVFLVAIFILCLALMRPEGKDK